MEEQVEAVQRMQDFIADHLSEPITLAALAKVSYFSPWYSYRLFVQHTNLTPADYIRRLRLSKSALQLRDVSCKIIDVALALGFGSVDGYQRAFLREFGYNPKEYAKKPVPLTLFTPYGVKYRTLRKEKRMEAIHTVFIKELEKPERKVLIKRGVTATDYFAYCDEVGCEVWGLLQSIKSLQGEPVCLWLPAQYIAPGTSQYVQGVELPLSYDGVVPEGFDVIVLPAAKYLLFIGEPFPEEAYCEAIETVQQAIHNFNPQTIGAQWDVSNPRIQLEPIGSRGYMELMPIR